MSLYDSVRAAIQKADDIDAEIPVEVRIRARRVGIIKAAGDISGIIADYHNQVTIALTTYFEGGNITAPRNQFKRATKFGFMKLNPSENIRNKCPKLFEYPMLSSPPRGKSISQFIIR